MVSKDTLERFKKALPRTYVPYTREKLSEQRGNRKLLSTLTEFNARLWLCINLAESTLECIGNGNCDRALTFFKRLDAGDEFSHDSLCAITQRVKRLVIESGESGCPISESVIDLTQAFATYLQLRSEIHATDSIVRADRAGRAIANILTSHDASSGDRELFCDHVTKVFEGLLSDLNDHYEKTASYLTEQCEKKRLETARKADNAIASAVENVGKSLAEIKIAVSKAGTQSAISMADVKTAADSAAEKIVKAVDKGMAKVAESANRKADALLASAGETLATVKRIDRRGKKDNRKRRFTVEQQEQCFRYWEIGRKHAKVKENTTGKVRYEHVFAYFRKELQALGVKSRATSSQPCHAARSESARPRTSAPNNLFHNNHVEVVIDLQHVHDLVKLAAALNLPVVELELALVFVPTASQPRLLAHQSGLADASRNSLMSLSRSS